MNKQTKQCNNLLLLFNIQILYRKHYKCIFQYMLTVTFGLSEITLEISLLAQKDELIY